MRHTPWGPSQATRDLADGITLHTTASHGGYGLTPARWRELKRALPGFQSWAGDGWLEEDCDAAAVSYVWPHLFADRPDRVAYDRKEIEARTDFARPAPMFAFATEGGAS